MNLSLKEIREAKGMSQEKLEAKSGVSRTTISLIETGKNENVKGETIRALADALGVPIEHIFSGMINKPEMLDEQFLRIHEMIMQEGIPENILTLVYAEQKILEMTLGMKGE